MNKSIVTIIIVAVVLVGGYFFFKGVYQPVPAPTNQLSVNDQLSQPSSELPSESKLLPESNGPISVDSSSPAENAESTVVYTDAGYSPMTLKVKVGTAVTFRNESLQSMWPASAMHPTHTIYSGTSLVEHCPDNQGIAFDACTGIQPGNSWSFTFNKKGTWKYHDHLNPSYFGTIVVE